PFSQPYSDGSRTAATEPVTPSSTLAIGLLLMEMFHFLQQARCQVTATDAGVAAIERTEQRPEARPLQRVGNHQVGGGLPPRPLGDLQELLVADADLQLELDQHTAEVPHRPDQIDQ